MQKVDKIVDFVVCNVGERESKQEPQISTKHRDGRQTIKYYLCRHDHAAV